ARAAKEPSPAPAVSQAVAAAVPDRAAASATEREKPKPTVDEHSAKEVTKEVKTQAAAPMLLAAAKRTSQTEESIQPPPVNITAATDKPSAALPALPALPSSLAVHRSVAVAAELLQGKAPQYPEAARRVGMAGTVKLQVAISAAGKGTDGRGPSGGPLLRQ